MILFNSLVSLESFDNLEREINEKTMVPVEIIQSKNNLMSKSSKKTYFTRNENREIVLISEDPEIISHICINFCDPIKKRIFQLLTKPLVRIDIVEKLELATTSGYRKIDELEESGLIIRLKEPVNSRNVLYDNVFLSMTTNISGPNESVELVLNPNVIKELSSCTSENLKQ